MCVVILYWNNCTLEAFGFDTIIYFTLQNKIMMPQLLYITHKQCRCWSSSCIANLCPIRFRNQINSCAFIGKFPNTQSTQENHTSPRLIAYPGRSRTWMDIWRALRFHNASKFVNSMIKWSNQLYSRQFDRKFPWIIVPVIKVMESVFA